MATNSTRSSKGRKSAKQRKEELRREELKRNITILGITGVLGIILFLANFGIIGTVGDALSGFFFGLFGSLWYVLPLVIITICFIVLFKPYSNSLIVGSVGLYFGLGFIFSLAQTKSAEKIAFAECFSAGLNDHKGGILTLWPASFLVSLLGKPGTWIFTILVVIASLVALIGFGNLVDLSDKVNEWADSDERQERIEYRRQRRAEAEALADERRQARASEREANAKVPRVENKAYGVEFTTLKENKPEINIPPVEISMPEIKIPSVEPVTPQFTAAPASFTDNIQEVTAESLRARAAVTPTPTVKEDIFDLVDQNLSNNIQADDADLFGIERRTVNPINFESNPNNSLITDGNRFVYESPEEKFAREQREKREKEKFQQSLASNVVDYMDYAPESIDTPAESTVQRRINPEPEQDFVPEPIYEATPDPIYEQVPEPIYEEKVEVEIEPVVPTPIPEPAPKPVVKPAAPKPKKKYVLPPIDLLNKPSGKVKSTSSEDLDATRDKLENTLRNFGVDARVTDVTMGPSVTRFEIEPAVGVKVSKIVNLSDDLKLNLAVADIRIEAPIPGKSAVGIEVPNKEAAAVPFREMVECPEFSANKSKIAFGAGRDIAGDPIISDIAKMPHVLIAGATGSGKSVCINTIIMSILYKATPDEVKMLMVDPKVVELSVYNGIPHLMLPVVTEPKKASAVLQSAVVEMENRFKLFAEYGVRDLAGFNQKRAEENIAPMPQIVIIVDELADLMMVAGKEVEESICRIAQLARACGMHLIIATQRPSVNVITGLIKANMPSRIAFAVTSGIDSRTILDMVGAEKLLGKGDMLYFPQNLNKPIRAQGAFVTDEEVSRVVKFLKENNEPAEADEEMVKRLEQAENQSVKIDGNMGGGDQGDAVDQLLVDAGRFIIEKNKASIGSLQRQFRVGFNRAARIMDQLCANGVVGPEEGTKPRMILMTLDEFDAYVESGNLQ